ncbi:MULTISPECIES: hypothetical protein [unclassified Ruegeria]|uniref:hypothetical protein n=1 Tax=unclassified Ruegeria TaxID=2625375 RepID=UPI00148896E2|nr:MULTISPECIES: hypothetical protein [unclassified Ruegeria]NOD62429.1 hypothetical protein [Ruegeria sp. HKCCD6109]
MSVRLTKHSDIPNWVELRIQLWDETSLDQHKNEAAAMLAKTPIECAVLLDVVEGVEVRAFSEAALRRDYMNGCETTPIAFLEGTLVRPKDQGSGVGRYLLSAV